MGFHDNDPTPVSEPMPQGFDPDGDPTPVQVPQFRPRSFPDPFDGDTVVAEPVFDFEVSPVRTRLKTPGREIPEVLRPPAFITDSGRHLAVDTPEETAPTAPISLDGDDLFAGIEESPLPPPMMMDPPAPRQLPLPWRGSAMRHAGQPQARGNGWLVMSLCTVAGAAVASAGFLIAGWLSEPAQPPTVRSTVEAIDRTRPAAASSAVPVVLPRLKLPTPEPVTERPVAASEETATDQPTRQAGERIARALRPCLRWRLDRSLRVAVYLLPAGTVRRAFVARRSWLTPYHHRCIKRRLVGLELPSFKHAGYADWRLTLRADSEEAVLLKRRGL
jgi:hypothetical protein